MSVFNCCDPDGENDLEKNLDSLRFCKQSFNLINGVWQNRDKQGDLADTYGKNTIDQKNKDSLDNHRLRDILIVLLLLFYSLLLVL